MKLGGFEVFLGNEAARGDRSHQEDYFALLPEGDDEALEGMLLVVADGMGGHVGGDTASVIAVDEFVRYWRQLSKDEKMSGASALERGIRVANRAVVATRGDTNMGSTFVTLYMAQSGELWWGSVGDSVVLRIREGEAQRLNRDHNVGQRMDRDVAAGRMTFEEAADCVHERPHLTSHLGLDDLEELDVSDPLEWRAGDTYLLCSDGLTDAMSFDEISDVASGGGERPLEEVSGALVEAALDKEKPHQDNITVVAVTVGKQQPQRRLVGLLAGGLASLAVIAAVLLLVFFRSVIWPENPPDRSGNRKAGSNTPIVDSSVAGSDAAPKDSVDAVAAESSKGGRKPSASGRRTKARR
jgi:serine/threonine protein phosphatase PrpC